MPNFSLLQNQRGLNQSLFWLLGVLLVVSFFTIPRNWAQEQSPLPPLLVVTELRTLGHQASTAQARAFSRFIRQEIESTGQYRLISNSSMASILQSRDFAQECHELPCFVRMGRLVGADQVVAGHLQSRNDEIEITLRLINVSESRIIKEVHRQGTQISSNELLDDWGRQLLIQLFGLEPEDFQVEKPQEQLTDEAKLAALPDSVKNKYPNMIYIPSGHVFMGTEDGDSNEQPQHRVNLDAFYIGRYEVTNQEYKEFIDDTGHRAPAHWNGNRIPDGKEKHPVVYVSHEDAKAYCQWKGARLPTEAEWERAAKAARRLQYPWGDEFDPKRANTWEAGRKDTAPIGSYPQGRSPFGVQDMAGNAFEWVLDKFKPYPNSPAKPEQFEQGLHVLRGGSWNFNSYYARTTHRFPRPANEIARTYGFRIARDAS